MLPPHEPHDVERIPAACQGLLGRLSALERERQVASVPSGIVESGCELACGGWRHGATGTLVGVSEYSSVNGGNTGIV